ncbi:MAG: inositol monophosphatase [Acidimicrobiales bacterium]
MDDYALLGTCGEVVDAVSRAIAEVRDWSGLGERQGQYAIDLAADAAALEVLGRIGVGVLSEESGVTRPGSEIMAVVDPVDGSTNASRGIPWYACSICMVDEDGPRVSVVANLASGVRYSAIRGEGSWRDGARLSNSGCDELSEAIVAVTGYPRQRMRWSQFRAFGAAALDLCAVAEGTLDAYAVVGYSSLGAWDYLGGMLVCTEAGAHVTELEGRELVILEHSARRAIIAAATPRLLEQVVEGALAARPDPSTAPGV